MTNENTPDTDLNAIIRDYAMLVAVHIKHWSAEIKDGDAERAAALASGADGADAYRAVKNLMHHNKTRLKAVSNAGGALRRIHNNATMNWDTGSSFRMLPTSEFMSYTQQVAKAKTHYETRLADFLVHYPVDAREARVALNLPETPDSLRLYPTEEELKHMFGVELAFEPIAEGQSFRNIPDGAAQALALNFEGKVTRRYQSALNTAYVGLLDDLVKLRGHLLAPNVDDAAQRWRNSCVYNVTAGARTLRGFDLLAREGHAEFCDDVQRRLGGLSDKALTKLRQPQSEDARQSLVDHVAQLEIMLESLIEEATTAEQG